MSSIAHRNSSLSQINYLLLYRFVDDNVHLYITELDILICDHSSVSLFHIRLLASGRQECHELIIK